MAQRKYIIITLLFLIFLMSSIVVGAGFALGWFTDDENEKSKFIDYGKEVKLSSNSEEFKQFASLNPGENIFSSGLSFNLEEDSGSAFIRAKYAISKKDGENLTNDEEKLLNFLKYFNISLGSEPNEYSWSQKVGDYYYLLSADGECLEVSSARSSDFVFISENDNKISYDIGYNPNNVDATKFDIAIGIEGIQSSRVEENTFENVQAKFDEIKNTAKTEAHNVVFNIDGEEFSSLNIAYAGSVNLNDLPVVYSHFSQASFNGFALENDGVAIIKTTSTNNHSYIKNSFLCNITEDIEFYLGKSYATYNVKFVSEGKEIQSKSVKGGERVSGITDPLKATSEGKKYTFSGWLCNIDGQIYSTTDLPKIILDCTFTAQFTSENIPIKITFDANGGTCAQSSKEFVYGQTIGPLPTSTKVGHTFLGWWTEQDGGEKILTSFVVKTACTIYAHWEARTYTITFDATGGTCSQQTKEVVYGQTFGDLPTATKDGFTFLGWFDEEIGGTKIERTANVTITSSITLYAHWEQLQTKLYTRGNLVDGKFVENENGSYIEFGYFPKTVKNDSVNIVSTEADADGYWLGDDDCKYVKISANPGSKTTYTYSDSTTENPHYVTAQEEYFKVEPILWKIIDEENGKALIYSDKILTANIPYYYYNKSSDSYVDTRTVGSDKKIQLSNYKYSNIRAYLNGLNASNYLPQNLEAGYITDYSGKNSTTGLYNGFINQAFSSAEQGIISTTTVLNDGTTNDNAKYNNVSLSCANTNDKIFLLSYQELNDKYFSSSSYTARAKKLTDYALANKADCYDEKAGGRYWTRSPQRSDFFYAWYLHDDGRMVNVYVAFSGSGVVPACWITL